MNNKTKLTPQNTASFDWIMIAVTTWFWAGIFLDGWAHNHIPIMETFFSPWHGVFYSGFFAICIALLTNFFFHLSKGYSLTHAVPKGYNISLIGLVVFGIAGLMDLSWHTLFGFEQDIDALLSPSHLLLALGGGFIIWGIISSSFERVTKRSDFFSHLPIYIASAYLLSLLGDMTQYSNPLVWLFPKFSFTAGFLQTAPLRQAAGASGIMLHTIFFMTILLFLLSRNKLLPGAITLIFTINAALLSVMKDQYLLILPLFIAGIFCDILLFLLRPTIQRSVRWYTFSFLVPFLYYIAYMMTLFATTQVWWSIHFWTGIIMAGGILGFLIAALFKAMYQK